MMWPRLLGVAQSAEYLGIKKPTVYEWHKAGILRAVPVPGAELRRNGKVVAEPRDRQMRKLLFDREELDGLVDSWKAARDSSVEGTGE